MPEQASDATEGATTDARLDAAGQDAGIDPATWRRWAFGALAAGLGVVIKLTGRPMPDRPAAVSDFLQMAYGVAKRAAEDR